MIAVLVFGGTPAFAWPAGGASAGGVSYNPGTASVYHAPISQVGILAVTHSYLHGGVGTPIPASPTFQSNLQTIPVGLIRFINDSSYIPQSETSISADPSNPDHIVGGYNDGRYFLCPGLLVTDCPSGYTESISGFAVSADGGKSVLKSDDIPGISASETNLTSGKSATGTLVSWGDPSVSAAVDGTFFYSALAIDPVTGANGIMLAKSNSNLWTSGFSCATSLGAPTTNSCWSAVNVYANLTYQCGSGACGTTTFEDKDVLSVDTDPSSAFFGYVYVAWDHFFTDGTSASYISRCSPTLSCTQISGGSAPVASGSDPYPGFSTPAVDSSGNLHVLWCNFGTATTLGPVTCNTRSSPPGGASFGSTSLVMSYMGVGTMFAADSALFGFATEQFRASSVPSFAVDSSGLASNLYFALAVCTSGAYYVFQNLPGGPTDNPGNCGSSGIFFSESTDGGTDWSSPIQVSKTGVEVQPAVAVDAKTGAVVVTYYSSEFDPFSHRLDVVASVSSDHGVTFSELRVTQVSDEPDADPAYFDYTSAFGGSFVVPQFGDYMSAAAFGGKVWVLFTGNYAVEEGTLQTDPFLAVIGEVPASLSLSAAPSGVAPGDTVTYNATGFTSGSTFQLSLSWGGAEVILANGTVGTNGDFSGDFVVPNVQSQEYSVVASDGNGVTATASMGVGQVSLAGVEAEIAALQQDVTSLTSSVANLGTALSGQIAALNASLSSASNGLQSSISSLGASLGIPGSGVSSPLVIVEVLLLGVMAVGLVTLVFVTRRSRHQS